MLGIRDHESRKKDNASVLLELLTTGVGEEKINKETNRIATDGDNYFEKNEIVSMLIFIIGIKTLCSISLHAFIYVLGPILKEFNIYSKLELGKALSYSLLSDMKRKGKWTVDGRKILTLSSRMSKCHFVNQCPVGFRITWGRL